MGQYDEKAFYLIPYDRRVLNKETIKTQVNRSMNRYQYSRHFPTSLGTAVQILPEKVHCYNYGA